MNDRPPNRDRELRPDELKDIAGGSYRPPTPPPVTNSDIKDPKPTTDRGSIERPTRVSRIRSAA
jgi:hypothetical protein